VNIILQLTKEGNSELEGCNNLEKAEVRQWIEYALLYATQGEVNPSSSQLLKVSSIFFVWFEIILIYFFI
jgi:hypothetical protein